MSTQEDIKVARERVGRYCAMGERSPKQVQDKLKRYGLNGDEVDQIVIFLTDQGYINERRFTSAFVNDKFRFNKWGKIRIKTELRLKHKIEEEVIDAALKDLDPHIYRSMIEELCENKLSSLGRVLNEWEKRKKIFNYLVSKGFEQDLVLSTIEKKLSSTLQ
jgi:regulatory protein